MGRSPMKKPVSTVRKVALMGSGELTTQKQQTVQQSRQGDLNPSMNNNTNHRRDLSLDSSSSWVSVCKKSFLWIVAISVATVLFLPKPQLIYYSVRGKEERSVYWPGFDDGAFDGRLLDADYAAAVNEETKTLYLCNRGFNGRVIDHCSKYPINKTKGLFFALFTLAKQDRIY